MKKIWLILIFLSLFFVNSVFAGKKILTGSELYEKNVKSIFFVETQNGTGSGIVLEEDGTFVTCFHVIADAEYIDVKTSDGTKYKVTGYKYLSPKTDVAILTLSSNKKFVPATIANKTNIGDVVYALANPKGLQFVLTDGMVNQLSKERIQFSAPSSSGSSGGALFNQYGELIGMITSQYNPSSAQNINFALPNSFYQKQLEKKNKKNTKKLDWSDFMASTMSNSELDEYLDFAIENDNNLMIYKFFKNVMDDGTLLSTYYARAAATALSSYLFSPTNTETVKDALRWFALSINSNKNVELSAYGLFLGSVVINECDNLGVYYDYLKKYSKTRKVLSYGLNKLYHCKEGDDKCWSDGIEYLDSYLNYLLRNCAE